MSTISGFATLAPETAEGAMTLAALDRLGVPKSYNGENARRCLARGGVQVASNALRDALRAWKSRAGDLAPESCPVCFREAVSIPRGRWLHMDGTDVRACWATA